MELGLSWLQIILLVMASLAFVVLKMAFRSVNAYLKKHWLLDSVYDGLMWVPLWMVGNEFVEWWVSAILVVGGMALLEHSITQGKSKQ